MRLFVFILVFLLSMNAGVAAWDASGLDSHMGIDPSTGDPQTLDTVEQSTDTVDPGATQDGTLFGMILNLGDTLALLLRGLSPAVAMFVELGAPKWAVGYLFTGIPIVGVVDFLAFLRGFNL